MAVASPAPARRAARWTAIGASIDCDKEEEMLKKITLAAAALTLGLSGTAFADECSGRDHSTGTVLGALGGGLLGGFASHGNGLGIIGGAILGGFAGNAISRDMDCDDRPYAARSYEQSFSGPVG